MASGSLWTDEEHDFLARCVVHKLKPRDLRNKWNDKFPDRPRGFEALRRRKHHPAVQDLVDEYSSRPDTPPLETTDQDLPELGPNEDVNEEPTIHAATTFDPVNPEKRWLRAEVTNEQLIDYHKARHHATLEFQTEKPIGLVMISDQHISQEGPTDLKRMREDAELVRDTPGLWAFLGGDGVNNHIKHRSAMIGSASKPGNEWGMYDHYLGIFGHKVAAMVSGNHDDWTKDFTDVDMVGRLASKHRIFYAPDHVLIRVRLTSSDGTNEYRIKVRHQYRYNSSFNMGHAVKRLWEMGESEFDIGVVGHHHEGHLESFMKHGLLRYAIRPGSYQVTSTYSRRFGYNTTQPQCPTVIVFPGERRMIGFNDVRDAASYLTWLRSNNGSK